MAAEYQLDRIDRRILKILQAEGRLTNQALAERVALSPSACLARVRHLERIGVIQGYHARLDPFRLDIGLVLHVEITLEGHRPDEQSRFEAAIEALPQVVEASHVSGDVDYLLKVAVQDMAEWSRLREQLIGGDLGVDRVTTHVLMLGHVIDDDRPAYMVEPQRNAASKLLEETAQAATHTDQVDADIALTAGESSAGTLRIADEIDAELIVVGPHRRQLLDGLVGTTAERTIRRSQRPVLMVNGEPSALSENSAIG